MKYIHYELRKLLGIRYIWIFLAVMLMANAILCVYTTGQKLSYSMPADVAGDFFELYFTDTERIESEYADLLALQQERDRLQGEAVSQGIYDFEPDPLPNKYIESGNKNDLTLFGEVFGRRDAILNYPGTIQKVIDRAYANLAEFDAMGVSADSYTYILKSR